MACSIVIDNATYRWIEHPAMQTRRFFGASPRASSAKTVDHPPPAIPDLPR